MFVCAWTILCIQLCQTAFSNGASKAFAKMKRRSVNSVQFVRLNAERFRNWNGNCFNNNFECLWQASKIKFVSIVEIIRFAFFISTLPLLNKWKCQKHSFCYRWNHEIQFLFNIFFFSISNASRIWVTDKKVMAIKDWFGFYDLPIKELEF